MGVLDWFLIWCAVAALVVLLAIAYVRGWLPPRR